MIRRLRSLQLAGIVLTAWMLVAADPPSRAEEPEGAGRITGYIVEIPPEAPEARAARHKRVAERRRATPVLVHRGATRFAPENTLEAFKAAMDRGADGVEIDIRRSSDGVLYLFHDDTLDRMTGCSGPVKGRSYHELLRCAAKGSEDGSRRGFRIPTLAALLVLARQRAMLLHLDIKEPGLEDDIEKLLDAADLWDHIVEVNPGNAGRLRPHSKVKLLAYKGWMPQDGDEPDWPAIRRFLDRDGQMVFVKWDPTIAVEALGRKPPEARSLPEGIEAIWTPDGMLKPR